MKDKVKDKVIVLN